MVCKNLRQQLPFTQKRDFPQIPLEIHAFNCARITLSFRANSLKRPTLRTNKFSLFFELGYIGHWGAPVVLIHYFYSCSFRRCFNLNIRTTDTEMEPGPSHRREPVGKRKVQESISTKKVRVYKSASPALNNYNNESRGESVSIHFIIIYNYDQIRLGFRIFRCSSENADFFYIYQKMDGVYVVLGQLYVGPEAYRLCWAFFLKKISL